MDHPEVREILGGDRLRDFRGAATPSLHRGNSMISFRVPSGGGGGSNFGKLSRGKRKAPVGPDAWVCDSWAYLRRVGVHRSVAQLTESIPNNVSNT